MPKESFPRTYSAFIVEDETALCNILVRYVSSLPFLRLVGFAHNGRDAIEAIEREKIDILLLDIDLPGLNGMEILRRIEKVGKKPGVIITTGLDGHAVEAFELGVTDYLTKPFTFERFQKAISRLIGGTPQDTGTSHRETAVFSFREKLNLFVVPHKEIIYLVSVGRRTVIHGKKRQYEATMQLKQALLKLPQRLFARIHKQYAVNMSFVSHLQYNLGGRYLLFLKNEENLALPVGAKFAPEIKIRLGL